MKITIREEKPGDYSQVSDVIRNAFEHEEYSDHKEHHLVERLRKSDNFIPELSLVAELNSKIIGHILFTRIHINNKGEVFESLALAPVSVHPDFQGKGIGGELIRAGHEVALRLGFGSVVLLGHAEYYPRFGYKTCSEFGIALPFDVPDENSMAIELVTNALKKVSGVVEYPREFMEPE